MNNHYSLLNYYSIGSLLLFNILLIYSDIGKRIITLSTFNCEDFMLKLQVKVVYIYIINRGCDNDKCASKRKTEYT